MGEIVTFLDKHTIISRVLYIPGVLFALYFCVRAIFFTTLEVVRPARKIAYGSVIWGDVGAYMVYVMVVYPASSYLNDFFPGHHPFPLEASRLPLALRVGLFVVLTDCGRYWIHRLHHTRYFWQMHKWHHAPTYMYWFAGVRATVPQQFMVNIPYVLGAPFLNLSPTWLILGMTALLGPILCGWMHMNVVWRSRWLEWILVTPRYHHIHHSDNPKHYNANLGSLFTIWDRLFGTYVDPESVDSELHFGIGESGNSVRIVLGV